MNYISMRHQKILLFVISFALSFGFFQACSKSPFGSEHKVTQELSVSHPDLGPSLKANFGQTRIPVADLPLIISRLLVSFFGEDQDEYSSAAQANLLKAELVPVQQAVGGICEIARVGSQQDCNFNTVHLGNKLISATSTLREAARIQACMRLTSDAGSLNALVTRIQGNSSGPEYFSIEALVQQFYPEGNPASLANKLISVDRNLASANESVTNRWRFLVQLVCESPGWQVL
jgi:hypothetical protein